MSKTIEVDTKTFVRFWLVVFALLLIGLLVVRAKTGLIIVGASIFVAAAIRPLVSRVNKMLRLKNHVGLAAGITVTGLVLIVGLIIATVGPVVITETSKFIGQAPEQVQSFLDKSGFIDEIGKSLGVENARVQIASFAKNTFSSIFGHIPETLFTSVSAIASFLMGTVLILVLTILFITQGPALFYSMLSKINAKNEKASRLTKRILEKISGVISGYVTGQLLVAVVDATFTGLAVFILSLIFGFSSGLALPMAMISLAFYMIPMFGQVMTDITVTLVLFISSPWAAIAFLVAYLIFAQIEANVIAPRVQGNRMSLPPLLILIAITLGMYTFGLIGAIISIPIAGIIKVLIDEYPSIRALSEN